jgi:hypothetical protein
MATQKTHFSSNKTTRKKFSLFKTPPKRNSVNVFKTLVGPGDNEPNNSGDSNALLNEPVESGDAPEIREPEIREPEIREPKISEPKSDIEMGETEISKPNDESGSTQKSNDNNPSLGTTVSSIRQFLSTNLSSIMNKTEKNSYEMDPTETEPDAETETDANKMEMETESNAPDKEKEPIEIALTRIYADEKYIQSIAISDLDIVPDTYLYKFAHFSKD